MTPPQRSAAAFSAGVFLHFIAPAVPQIVNPEPNTTRFAAIAAGVLVSASMALPAFAGSWFAFAVLTRAIPLLPPLYAAALGLAFAFAIEPALQALRSFGVDLPFGPFGFMLSVAIAATLLAAIVVVAAAAIQR